MMLHQISRHTCKRAQGAGDEKSQDFKYILSPLAKVLMDDICWA